MKDFERLSLAEIATGYRKRDFGPTDVARWCEAGYLDHDYALGAYKYWAGTSLIEQAELAERLFAAGRDTGALQGIPFSAKDIYGVPDMPVFAGSPRELPAAWQRPGPLVRSLLGQLAIVTGKTHTVEFAYGGLGSNPHWPTPINPWDTENVRMPGGSSAGAGVSLCTHSALLALGTDTGGSVRIPASMTGNVGLKLSYGRWSRDGIVPLSPSFDTPGLLTRSVKDATYVFEALDGERVVLRDGVAGLRIGVPERFFWDDCSPGIAEAVESALAELVCFGARRQPIEIDGVDTAYRYFCQGGLTPPELYTFLRHELPGWLETLDHNVSARMQAAASLTACDYLERRHYFQRTAASATEKLAEVDVVAVPTVAVTPPTAEAVAASDDYARLNIKVLRNTSIANLLDLCAVTLPVGRDAAGLPVGLMLMAVAGSETRLLATAQAVEACLGGAAKRLGRPPRLL